MGIFLDGQHKQFLFSTGMLVRHPKLLKHCVSNTFQKSFWVGVNDDPFLNTFFSTKLQSTTSYQDFGNILATEVYGNESEAQHKKHFFS